jgi:hypothetical protein
MPMPVPAQVALLDIATGRRRVAVHGSADGKNDVMLYSVVQAETHEAASKMFEDHPHLGIPSASIEITRSQSRIRHIRPLP